MVKIENYDPFETDIWFYCEEGDANVVTTAENEEILTFSNQLVQGDYVKLVNTKDKTVAKAGANDEVIGVVITQPKYDGSRPSQTSASGTYDMRICTVRLFGYYVHTVELISDNKVIAVGDPVKYAGDNKFDKGTASNKAKALVSAEALSGKKIPVLMGLLGF